MILKKVYAIYFSPTGTTEKSVTSIAEGTGLPCERIDLTTLKRRETFNRSFSKNELVIVGMPVYGGRLPYNLEDFFAGLNGKNTPAVALVMYGNREYEDALIELKIRLEERGFKVIAAAAFIGEHTFSKNIAGGRPDASDLKIAGEVGRKVIRDIGKAIMGILAVKGNYPYIARGFDPAHSGPVTTAALVTATEECTLCGLCVEECPWGAITVNDVVAVDYMRCLRCLRCIRVCPAGALKITDPKYYEAVAEFERRLNAVRKEPELFLPQ